MYLNERKIMALLLYSKVQFVIGVVFVVFFGMAVVFAITDYESLGKYLVTYIICLLPFILMIWLSIQKKNTVEQARKLNGMFCSDADGDVYAPQIAFLLNCKSETQAMQRVVKLVGKGYLRNCTIEHQPSLHIVLYKESDGAVTTTITCPKCGAEVEKRVGFSTTCPYCRTKIS